MPRTVLDLACGDGPLLQILSDRGHAGTKLVGVDMSDDELSAAREVLPHEIRLLKERAHELSLDSGSVDYALSHMALMLMDDIEQATKYPSGRNAPTFSSMEFKHTEVDALATVAHPGPCEPLRAHLGVFRIRGQRRRELTPGQRAGRSKIKDGVELLLHRGGADRIDTNFNDDLVMLGKHSVRIVRAKARLPEWGAPNVRKAGCRPSADISL